MRPIVSFVNSPTYAISGYLICENLSPVVGNIYSTVKNSPEFADFIRDKTLNACEELVFFDVFSLFPKILVDLAVKVAGEKLRGDPSLGQRISSPVFICCLFASKTHNLYTRAPTINRFLVRLWVHPSLLLVSIWLWKTWNKGP